MLDIGQEEVCKSRASLHEGAGVIVVVGMCMVAMVVAVIVVVVVVMVMVVMVVAVVMIVVIKLLADHSERGDPTVDIGRPVLLRALVTPQLGM